MWTALFLKTYTFFPSVKLLPGDGNVWDFFSYCIYFPLACTPLR